MEQSKHKPDQIDMCLITAQPSVEIKQYNNTEHSLSLFKAWTVLVYNQKSFKQFWETFCVYYPQERNWHMHLFNKMIF